jgi:hypothetical protein
LTNSVALEPVALVLLAPFITPSRLFVCRKKQEKEELSACRGEGSLAGLQLRVRFVLCACCAALQCVSKASSSSKAMR